VSHLSYWEKSIYFNEVDVVIAGAGIAGLCTGISLLEKDPSLRVLILERNYLPLGASTKNAGFACFGSPSELLEDLKLYGEENVFAIFKKRFEGIQKLLHYTGTHAIDYKREGGFELLHPKYSNIQVTESDVEYLNSCINEYSGLKEHFYFANDKLKEFGLTRFEQLIANDTEAGLHPVKMMEVLTKIFTDKKGKILFGANVESWNEQTDGVQIQLHDQSILYAGKFILCINAFTKKMLPELELRPARNMVMMLKPGRPIKLKGCFHVDRGYIYFRDVDGMLLIGGGRNVDLENEFTSEFGFNEIISSFLVEFARENILINNEFTITDQWSGIIGLGIKKSPIIKMISNHVAVSLRLGGMGIAIGSLVGEETADMVYNSINELR